MKKLIPILIVLLAALLFVFMPSKHTTSTPEISGKVSMATYDEVENAIEQLGNAAWQREKCNVVRTDINHLYKNKIINDQQKDKLDKRLEVEYIKTLNNAAKEFFSQSQEDGLGPVYDELKKYKSKPEYAAQVAYMLTAAERYFQLLRNKEIVNAMIKHKLLKEKVIKIREDIHTLASSDPLNTSSHVQNITKEIDVVLDDFVTMCLDFESDSTDSIDCDTKYSKYDFYKNECKKH
jgi:hypothetical protein